MKTNIKIEENNSLNYESLIQNLKSNDTEQEKKNRKVILIGFFLIIAWGFSFVQDFNANKSIPLFRVFLIAVFAVFLVYSLFYIRKLKNINYSDSVKNLLFSAEKRYRFWNSKMIFETIGTLFIGVFLGYFIFNRYSLDWSEIKNLTISIFVPVFIISFSMFRSFAAWKKEKKELWLAVKNVLKEFEE